MLTRLADRPNLSDDLGIPESITMSSLSLRAEDGENPEKIEQGEPVDGSDGIPECRGWKAHGVTVVPQDPNGYQSLSDCLSIAPR